LFDIQVEVIYFGRKQRPSACFQIFIDDDDDDDDDDDEYLQSITKVSVLT